MTKTRVTRELLIEEKLQNLSEEEAEIYKVLYKYFEPSDNGIINEKQYKKYFVFGKLCYMGHVTNFGKFVIENNLQNKTLDEIIILWTLQSE